MKMFICLFLVACGGTEASFDNPNIINSKPETAGCAVWESNNCNIENNVGIYIPIIDGGNNGSNGANGTIFGCYNSIPQSSCCATVTSYVPMSNFDASIEGYGSILAEKYPNWYCAIEVSNPKF